MKKVLSLVSYSILPYSTGGQKSIAQFNEYLGGICSLTVVSTKSNDIALAKNYTMLPWMGNGVFKFIDITLVFKLKKYILANNITHVMIEHPYLGLLIWLLRLTTPFQTIVHTHNIEYKRFKSLKKWWWPLLKLYEKKVLHFADKVFCISGDDKKFMVEQLKLPLEKCTVIPFGVPQADIPQDKIEARNTIAALHNILPDEKILLFNGTLDYEPNKAALSAIIDYINPILLANENLSYKIIICGKGLPPEFNQLKAYSNKRILYAGFVNDIETYFKAADIFLNAVVKGGGVKTKLIEAIAYNTTVISTVSGAIGCDATTTGNKLIIIPDNDWKSFAEATIQHIVHKEDTPALFYESYYWGNITKRALTAIQA